MTRAAFFCACSGVLAKMLRLIAAFFFVCMVSVTPAEEPNADRPNVLFVICDDLNCDIACYGHRQVKTPNIDRLAKRGVRFDQAYCQYPLCGPSRASFMTGMYPDQTLVKGNAIYIRQHLPKVNTMSQMFRDAGYTATRIGKIYHYNVPLHVGTSGHDDPYSWDFTVNPRGKDRERENETIFSLRPGSFGGTLSWRADEGPDEIQTDGIAATVACEMLGQYASEKTPFFLAVGLYRPHTPYVAPKKYFDMYPVDSIVVPEVPDGYLDTLPEPARKSLTQKKDQVDLAPSLARQAIQAYYASITFADAQIGRILDGLDDAGLTENTIIVFTSDHGYHMGEHGHYQKTTLFENATRVPLVMAGPGISEDAASASMAEMIDFYPTLADLAGLQAPRYLAGVSLAPTLAEPSKATRQSALSHYKNGYSLRTPEFRYTQWGEDGSAGNELYDHKSDPGEMKNLADDPNYAGTVQSMREAIRSRITDAKVKPVGLVRKP